MCNLCAIIVTFYYIKHEYHNQEHAMGLHISIKRYMTYIIRRTLFDVIHNTTHGYMYYVLYYICVICIVHVYDNEIVKYMFKLTNVKNVKINSIILLQ